MTDSADTSETLTLIQIQLARIEEKQDAAKELFAERINEIERDVQVLTEDAIWSRRMQWIHSAFIIPVTMNLSYLAKRVGGHQ
jgi:hypothetical protein